MNFKYLSGETRKEIGDLSVEVQEKIINIILADMKPGDDGVLAISSVLTNFAKDILATMVSTLIANEPQLKGDVDFAVDFWADIEGHLKPVVMDKCMGSESNVVKISKFDLKTRKHTELPI